MEADAFDASHRTSILILHLDVTEHPDVKELRSLVQAGDVKPLLDRLDTTNTTTLRAWSVEVGEGDLQAKPLRYLNLNSRAMYCLGRAGVETVGELVDRTESEIKRIPRLGEHTLRHIKEVLAGHGLELAEHSPSSP